MTRWKFEKGLHDLGDGCFAYLQPDGSWGWSNAGLIVDGKETLLVDTLFDLFLTREMLDTMRRSVPQAAHIDVLVNTHSNGDHTFGNQLVEGAQIISTEGCLAEMEARPPEEFIRTLESWRDLGEAGGFLQEVIGSRFDFDGIVYTPPTQTFAGSLDLTVGAKDVRLVDVGPAHTRGDVLIYLPEERTVFTGDILFVECHPVIWAGPVKNWIKACDLILDWDVETVVPGHGPITDKKGVRAMKEYLEYLTEQAFSRYQSGLGPEEAAYDIALDMYEDWYDQERIVLNVHALYREFSGSVEGLDSMEMFAMMSRYRKHFGIGHEPSVGTGQGHHSHRST